MFLPAFLSAFEHLSTSLDASKRGRRKPSEIACISPGRKFLQTLSRRPTFPTIFVHNYDARQVTGRACTSIRFYSTFRWRLADSEEGLANGYWNRRKWTEPGVSQISHLFIRVYLFPRYILDISLVVFPATFSFFFFLYSFCFFSSALRILPCSNGDTSMRGLCILRVSPIIVSVCGLSYFARHVLWILLFLSYLLDFCRLVSFNAFKPRLGDSKFYLVCLIFLIFLKVFCSLLSI